MLLDSRAAQYGATNPPKIETCVALTAWVKDPPAPRPAKANGLRAPSKAYEHFPHHTTFKFSEHSSDVCCVNGFLRYVGDPIQLL